MFDKPITLELTLPAETIIKIAILVFVIAAIHFLFFKLREA